MVKCELSVTGKIGNMQRRNFLKISALSGAVAALQSCGSPEEQLVRFIPDEDLVPGIATWKPSVCTLCSAGCGTLVRVMEGDAEVVRNARAGLVKMGLAKKLEGNPQHPVNRGKLCARGHAALQVLYHPDRIANPLKRRGPRGSADFQVVSWEDALAELTSHLSELPSPGNVRPSDSRGGRRAVETGPVPIAFLTRPLRGQRGELIERFLKALGAPPSVSYEPLDEAVLRRANLLSFGSAALPTLDLARADYLISFGADLLGTWNSPVARNRRRRIERRRHCWRASRPNQRNVQRARRQCAPGLARKRPRRGANTQLHAPAPHRGHRACVRRHSSKLLGSKLSRAGHSERAASCS